MKSTDGLEGMAPKRRRMMEMVLALGGLKEEAVIPPGKINETINSLKIELSPLVEQITSFPDEYYESFAAVTEQTQLPNKIEDRNTLKMSIDNLKKANTRWNPGWVYAARGDLGADIVEKIKRALLKLDSKKDEHQRILQAADISDIIPAEDGDFDPVRQLAVLVGMNLEE